MYEAAYISQRLGSGDQRSFLFLLPHRLKCLHDRFPCDAFALFAPIHKKLFGIYASAPDFQMIAVRKTGHGSESFVLKRFHAGPKRVLAGRLMELPHAHFLDIRHICRPPLWKSAAPTDATLLSFAFAHFAADNSLSLFKQRPELSRSSKYSQNQRAINHCKPNAL